MNIEGGSSSYGGVIPRSRSSSGQALYMGLNGDGYQRSTSMDDGSGQVTVLYLTYRVLQLLVHRDVAGCLCVTSIVNDLKLRKAVKIVYSGLYATLIYLQYIMCMQQSFEKVPRQRFHFRQQKLHENKTTVFKTMVSLPFNPKFSVPNKSHEAHSMEIFASAKVYYMQFIIVRRVCSQI